MSLAAPFAHYGGELRLVAAASRRLVDKLMLIERADAPGSRLKASDTPDDPFLTPERHPRQWKNIPAEPIRNLAEELLANRSLLASLAGPTIAPDGRRAGRRSTSAHDLRRPYPHPGEPGKECRRSHVGCGQNSHHAVGKLRRAGKQPLADPECGRQRARTARTRSWRASSNLGTATRRRRMRVSAEWPLRHRGLGLSITRSVVEAAGGLIHAANRDPVGACFQIELPVRSRVTLFRFPTHK